VAPAEPPVDNTPTEPQSNGEVQELNIAIFEGGYGKDFWVEAAELFEAENQNYKVNLQISPDIGDIVRPQIISGDPPDLTNFADGDQTGIVTTLIKDRGLLDITDLFDGPQYDSSDSLRSKIIPGVLESNKCTPYQDGRIYLAPGALSPMGPIYNATLFSEQNWSLPVTWDDFFALGDQAKAIGTALFTYQGIYPSYMESMLLPALASALGPDYAKIENFTPGIWTDPRTVAVLEQFEKIYTGGYLMEGTVGLDHTDSQTAQMNNKALFIPCGTWMESEMKDVDRAIGYKFGLAPPPLMNPSDTRYVASYTEQFSIPAAAKNPEGAKQFLRFLYTDKIVEMYAKYNGGAVLSTVNALDQVKDYLTEDTYSMQSVFNQPGVTALIFGFAAPPEDTKINYSDEIYKPLSDVMTGNMTAAQWAENVDRAYQDMAEGR